MKHIPFRIPALHVFGRYGAGGYFFVNNCGFTYYYLAINEFIVFAYKINGLYDQAITDISQAIRLAPNLDYAYFNRGRTYEINGERQRAVKDFMKSYALKSDDRAYQAKMKELGLLQ